MGGVRAGDDDLDCAVSMRGRPLRVPFVGLIGLALFVGACTTGMSGSSADRVRGSATPAADSAWRTTTLRDVRTGEAFTIDGLRDKLVALEPMAIWCSNCRIQQREAVAALAAVASG